MTAKLSALTLIILLTLPAVYGAEKKSSHADGIAIGLAGGGGIAHAYAVKDSSIDWEPGPSVHLGMIFEKMFTKRWGLHSGFWLKYSKVWWSDPAVTTDAYSETGSIEIPVDAIISFNKSFFSFNILTGLTFSQVLNSTLKDKTTGESFDFLHSTNQFQIAFDLGFNLKFRVGTYTDLFLGIKGQAYLLPIMNDTNGDEDNFNYGAFAFAGVMFRMSIFPY